MYRYFYSGYGYELNNPACRMDVWGILEVDVEIKDRGSISIPERGIKGSGICLIEEAIIERAFDPMSRWKAEAAFIYSFHRKNWVETPSFSDSGGRLYMG